MVPWFTPNKPRGVGTNLLSAEPGLGSTWKPPRFLRAFRVMWLVRVEPPYRLESTVVSV